MNLFKVVLYISVVLILILICRPRNTAVYFPLDGTVTSVFAVRNDPFGSGETETHEGLDIAVIDSTDILAAMDGVVKTVSYSNGYGNYIIIRHSDEM